MAEYKHFYANPADEQEINLCVCGLWQPVKAWRHEDVHVEPKSGDVQVVCDGFFDSKFDFRRDWRILEFDTPADCQRALDLLGHDYVVLFRQTGV